MSDADLEIIDAHHHYWDLSLGRHPWLRPEAQVPFRYGDYSAIKRDFLPPDYAKVSQRHRVVASITMEGEWDARDLVAESRWMTDIAHRHGTPAAHVARAILDREDVETVLAAHAAFPLVRGIRHKPVVAPSSSAIATGTPGSMSDPAWRRGYALLAGHGLHFELQAPWWHVDELMELVAAYPETTVVINHAFLPADRDAAGLAGWRAAIRRAATLPQATIKISGIGVRDRPWSLADNRGIVDSLIEAFGVARCMFASNFPVDGLTGSFDTIFDGYKAATAALPDRDRRRLFHDNAVRIYRIAPDAGTGPRG